VTGLPVTDHLENFGTGPEQFARRSDRFRMDVRWMIVWRRFRRNRMALFGGVIVLFLLLVAIFANQIAPFDPIYQYPDGLGDIGQPLPANSKYIMGTDRYGRDVFSRLVFGTRVSLTVGILANGTAMVIGVLIGSIAGFMRGTIETLLMRLTDIMLSIPMLLLAMVLVVIWKPSLLVVIIVIAISFWTALARVIHGEVLHIREYAFVEASRALGGAPGHLLFAHILPQLAGITIVYLTLGVATTVMLEASLSYLGLGIPAPTPSWGGMVAEGQAYFRTAPWLVLWPGLAVMLTVLGFNLLGDGLRDALDSKTTRL
jgi:peptide/nickel transport system permease protein